LLQVDARCLPWLRTLGAEAAARLSLGIAGNARKPAGTAKPSPRRTRRAPWRRLTTCCDLETSY
jgi:hypothetical protein